MKYESNSSSIVWTELTVKFLKGPAFADAEQSMIGLYFVY